MRFLSLAACGLFLLSSLNPIHAAPCDVYFSPDDHLAEHLISLIHRENNCIKAAIYSLTHRGVAKALIQAKERGVHVELVVDSFSIKARAPAHRLVEKGLDVYVWQPTSSFPSKKGGIKALMHDKFCIFGEHAVWTGSFNFTLEANRSNRENVVVLHDVEVVKLYDQEFERMKERECCTLFQFMLNKGATSQRIAAK